MSASPQAAIQQVQDDANALQQGLGPRPLSPDQDPQLQQDRAKTEAAQTAYQEQSSQNLPKPVGPAKLPQTPNKPLVDPGEYSSLSAGLLAMALIAGAKSGNWYGASASLNGALKGLLEGNQAQADASWKKYQADYDKAVKEHDEMVEEYRETMENNKLTLNQKFQQWQMQAAKNHDDYMLAVARSKSYDQAIELIGKKHEMVAQLSVRKEAVDKQANKAFPAAAGGDPEKVRGVRAAMSDLGISFPPGMRSEKAQNETIQGLLEAHPDDTPQQIAARVKAGELGIKGAQTELNVVARREGASAAAINALNRDGGLYDQLLETGKKVDFGSAKIANSMRLKAQGQAIADPDISEYVNALSDTRAEFASVLARGGQVTDSVRIASEHAFPDNMSYQELARNIDRSKKIAAAIQAGNTSVADALINGRTMEEALKSPDKAAGGAKPYADPDKEARYQKWKAEHVGAQ